MAGRDDESKGPNPAFLKTRTLGSRDLSDIDYDDDRPTGVGHRSERPPPAGPARVDPSDVFYLTDPARAKLPSFQETAPGPRWTETPRSDLPPVAPTPSQDVRIAPQPRVSSLAHSPVPSAPQTPAPTVPSVPTFPPVQSRPVPLTRTKSRPPSPMRHRRRRARLWKPVVPPPRFPPSEPLARVIPPRPEAMESFPRPVEDRLLNAVVVLFIGSGVAFVAGLFFLVVTNMRASALSDLITEPLKEAVPSASSPR